MGAPDPIKRPAPKADTRTAPAALTPPAFTPQFTPAPWSTATSQGWALGSPSGPDSTLSGMPGFAQALGFRDPAQQAQRKSQLQAQAEAAGVPQHYAMLLDATRSELGPDTVPRAKRAATLLPQARRLIAAQNRMLEWQIRNEVSAGVVEGEAMTEHDLLAGVIAAENAELQPALTELGLTDASQLEPLVQEQFPPRFLEEAKRVAHQMLDLNQKEAESEMKRYAALICSPDIEGLLAADRQLSELDPRPAELDVSTARAAMSRYAPSAGVMTLDDWARALPEGESSTIVVIAHLDAYEVRAKQRRELYELVRLSHARSYPILLGASYVPGTFSAAPPDKLGEVTAAPLQDILDNIARVREAINDNDMRVWHMNSVLEITIARLGIDEPALLEAINTRIKAIEAEKSFLGWVKAALAIVTTVIAFAINPLAGAAVGALWGTASLVHSIGEYRNERAAENIAIDPAVADISMNEPSLLWVVLDAAFLLLDVGAVARALRPAARLLSAQRNLISLAVFRRRAAAELGEEAGERLATQAAQRMGLGAVDAATEATLARARSVLAGLDLSDEAIARVLAKSADVDHVKGQLLEELVDRDIARRLAAGGDALLGTRPGQALEHFAGHRISSLGRKPLTDGIIVSRATDSSLEIHVVIEAKAGASSAQGLRRVSDGIGDPAEFARFVIEQERAAVVRLLRKSGLEADARLAEAGKEGISEAAIEAIGKDKGLRRTVTQAELGGQVRKDVERLAPGADDGDSIRILIDNQPTTVRISPTRTRFVGAVPAGVRTDAIEASLRGEGFNFRAAQIGPDARALADLAQRLMPVPAAVP